MTIETRIFGEVTIDSKKIINFENGIIGFPELTDFALIYDADKGDNAGIRWMQSLQEPAFAIPVMDPLLVCEDYNPTVDDEILKPIDFEKVEDVLILVTVTVPRNLKLMSVNLKAPIIINVPERKALQVILDNEDYLVKYPIYDLLNSKKEGTC